MQLFSKRNQAAQSSRKASFLKDTLRIRLLQEIGYITSTNEFLERCFLVKNEKSDTWYLDEESISNLSLRELGYDLSKSFDFNSANAAKYSSKVIYLKEDEDQEPDDYLIFDLVEILLIFSKEDKRKLVRDRFQKHFIEEGNEYVVHDFLIAQKDTAGVKPYVSFLKDKILREKFEQYYTVSRTGIVDYGSLARISADILQFLFSGEKQKDTKSYAEKLVKDLATKCVAKENVGRFSIILNKIILDAKSLNNEVSNIRHTDKNTLLIDNPSLFKLITANNLYLSELAIFADPEKYFFSQKAIDSKNEYITNYNISVEGWIIRNPKKDEDEIKPEDIPF